MKLKYLLMWFWLSVPIIGSGTDKDPYRPDIPAALLKLPNVAWTAHIPSNPDGSPKFGDAVVWIPDRISLPPGVKTLDAATARATIKARDNKADADGIDRLK